MDSIERHILLDMDNDYYKHYYQVQHQLHLLINYKHIDNFKYFIKSNHILRLIFHIVGAI